jgi:hypothetical protein
MNQPAMNQHARRNSRPRPLLTPMVIRLVIPTAIGLFGFCLCQYWDVQYSRRMEMIGRGEVKPEALQVLKIFKRNGDDWNVSLGRDRTHLLWRPTDKVEDLHQGSEIKAYRFGNHLLVPRFDRGGYTVKWFLLAFGLLSFLLAGGRLLWVVSQTSSEDPNELRSTAGKPIGPMVSAPAAASFDRVPDDSQLACLLGSWDWNYGLVKMVEDGGLLIARPRRIPLWFAALFIVSGFVVITVLAVHAMGNSDPLMWLWLGLGWFVGLPVFLGIAAAVYYLHAKQGDYFRVNLVLRTLELCQADRTFKVDEIIAITSLMRWYRAFDEWGKVHQTGMLVRTRDGRVEFYPVVPGIQLADRLAASLQVPVRRIEVNKTESRALNDC